MAFGRSRIWLGWLLGWGGRMRVGLSRGIRSIWLGMGVSRWILWRWLLGIVGVLTILEHRFFAGRLRDSTIIRSEAVQRRYKEPILILGGLVIGLCVGMTSVGSGAILMAVLLLVSELGLLVLVGTDLVHATILLAAAGGAHFVRGHVEIPIVISLLAGSLPGIWVGARLAQRVPTTALRYTLSVLLIVTGVKLLSAG
jgi:uncharacterized membrane protein YfcA